MTYLNGDGVMSRFFSYPHLCVCAHMHGRMLLLLLGLLFVTVIPPNEEVEWVSLLYCSHLQTPYQMPYSLPTSRKHFIFILAHRPKTQQASIQLPFGCTVLPHPALLCRLSEWAPHPYSSCKCFFELLHVFPSKRRCSITIEKGLRLVSPPASPLWH